MLDILFIYFINRLAARLAMVFLLIACSAHPALADSLTVSLVLSDSTPSYQQFSAALNKALVENHADVAVVESQAGEKLKAGSNGKIDLVVAVGVKAAEFAAANFNAPLLSVMVPKTSYEALLEKHSSRYSAKTASVIYLDQPWDRQLSFIQAAFPKHSVVGVLYSPNTPIVLPRLPRGMSLNAKSVRPDGTLFAALEDILNDSDVLLVIPDGEIYSSNNVRNILLTSYRHKVPLIGISQAYVNAGALGAIFSTPEQLAKQAGEAVIFFEQNRLLPEPRYPVLFSIAVNQQIARSLGIALDSPEAIRERMNKAVEGEQ